MGNCEGIEISIDYYDELIYDNKTFILGLLVATIR